MTLFMMSTQNWAGQIPVQMTERDRLANWLHDEFSGSEGVHQSFFSAGTPVRVFSRNHAIHHELRALVATKSASPALQVFAAQTTSSVALENLKVLRRGILGTKHADRYFISIERDRGNFFVFDAQTRKAFWGVKNLRPEWHVSSPLRQILHTDVAQRGGILLHSAMIGTEEKCVVIAGPSYAGKSTVTAWAVAAGFLSGGDDYTCLFLGADGWVASTVYRVVKLRDNSPALGSLDFLENVRIPEENRTVFYLDRANRLPETHSIPLHAILTMGSAEQEVPIQRISALGALTKLAPSTLLQASFFENEILERSAHLSTETPAFQIQRPHNQDQLADMLSRVLGASQDELRSHNWK